MKKFFAVAVLVIVALVFVASTQAMPITMRSLGAVDGKGGIRRVAGRYAYIGLYSFEVNGDPFDGFYIDVWRRLPWIRFLRNRTWQTELNTPSDIESGVGQLYHRLGGQLSVERITENYRMVGWIYNEYFPTLVDRDDYVDFSEALALAGWYSDDWSSWLSSSFNWWRECAGWQYDVEVKAMILNAVESNAYNIGTPLWAYTPTAEYRHSQEIINPVSISEPLPAPEPHTLLLLGSGLLGFVGLGFLRRRKKTV
jgi:hypothetical protein